MPTYFPFVSASPNVRVGERVAGGGPTHRRSHHAQEQLVAWEQVLPLAREQVLLLAREQVLLLARERGRCCAYCEVLILPRLSLKSAFSGDQISRLKFVAGGWKYTCIKKDVCAVLLRTATLTLASRWLLTQNCKKGNCTCKSELVVVETCAHILSDSNRGSYWQTIICWRGGRYKTPALSKCIKSTNKPKVPSVCAFGVALRFQRTCCNR